MERLILDTGVLIATERAMTSAEPVAEDSDIAIAAVTVAELLVGVELADAGHREQRRRLVDALVSRIEIIAYDQQVARHHAALLVEARRAGRPRGTHDLQIAATARATDRVIVTTDATAFTNLSGVAHRVLA